MYIVSILVSLAGAHVMWSKGLELNRGQNQLTMYILCFFDSWVIGLELRSGALGAWCLKPR